MASLEMQLQIVVGEGFGEGTDFFWNREPSLKIVRGAAFAGRSARATRSQSDGLQGLTNEAAHESSLFRVGQVAQTAAALTGHGNRDLIRHVRGRRSGTRGVGEHVQ